MSRLSFYSFPDVRWTGVNFGSQKFDPGCNFLVNLNTKMHFTVNEYISGDAIHSKRHVLKATAVPTIFPWTTEKHIQTSITSKWVFSQLTSDDNSMKFESYVNDSPEIICHCEQLQQEIEELRSKLTQAENKLRRS